MLQRAKKDRRIPETRQIQKKIMVTAHMNTRTSAAKSLTFLSPAWKLEDAFLRLISRRFQKTSRKCLQLEQALFTEIYGLEQASLVCT